MIWVQVPTLHLPPGTSLHPHPRTCPHPGDPAPTLGTPTQGTSLHMGPSPHPGDPHPGTQSPPPTLGTPTHGTQSPSPPQDPARTLGTPHPWDPVPTPTSQRPRPQQPPPPPAPPHTLPRYPAGAGRGLPPPLSNTDRRQPVPGRHSTVRCRRRVADSRPWNVLEGAHLRVGSGLVWCGRPGPEGRRLGCGARPAGQRGDSGLWGGEARLGSARRLKEESGGRGLVSPPEGRVGAWGRGLVSPPEGRVGAWGRGEATPQTPPPKSPGHTNLLGRSSPAHWSRPSVPPTRPSHSPLPLDSRAVNQRRPAARSVVDALGETGYDIVRAGCRLGFSQRLLGVVVFPWH
ncbi:proline-rich protein 2-like [Leucoraja erinacea]|uniref:proline-rich protein 2-like n=1 Tax=Leucoraja erinaceus TaxID=7782 RepID=UPI002455E5A1|nr:proline-rich protein 2-like [Leucoraja erinacea]